MANCDNSAQTFIKRHKKLGLLLGGATLAVSPALVMTSQASAQTPAAPPIGACIKCLEYEVQAELTFEARLVKEEAPMVAAVEREAAILEASFEPLP